jgi:hypothetical protein
MISMVAFAKCDIPAYLLHEMMRQDQGEHRTSLDAPQSWDAPFFFDWSRMKTPAKSIPKMVHSPLALTAR